MRGRIIKVLSGFYYVESNNEVYQCKARGKFRKYDHGPLVGDYCEFSYQQGSDGYILTLDSRKNELVRPPICNIDQALLVFSIEEPHFSSLLLDRFLIMIENQRIEPIICISKIDLSDYDTYTNLLKPYIQSGYKVFFVSNKTGEGIDDIKKIFKDQVTVVTGQSGVGKSSLLNALDIHLNINTNEISKSLGRGKHTTRHVELLKMHGGYVADTPGFSSLDLTIDPVDLACAYHDFDELSRQCRFRGCLHNSEPDCAVKEAVQEGTISKERYEHYLTFLKECKEYKEKRYD